MNAPYSLYATSEAKPLTVAPRTQGPTIWRRGYAAVNEAPAIVGIFGQAIETPDRRTAPAIEATKGLDKQVKTTN
jgi:hypothetical protein